MTSRWRTSFVSTSLLLVPLAAKADWRDTIGWEEFKILAGTGYPDGSGVLVIQSEAQESPTGSNKYVPTLSDPQFVGKSIVDQNSPTGLASGHATRVGLLFYGNELAASNMNSVAQGVTDILAYEANAYINDLINDNPNTASDLIPSTRKVHSAAWVGNLGANAVINLTRADLAIAENGYLLVAGLGNSIAGNVPEAMATTFNALSVGRSSGGHSQNGTAPNGTVLGDYVPGRMKPELVAPQSFTSYSTGAIASVAAVLYEIADNDASLSNAYDHSEVMKAILMAGAVKDKFADWDRTTTRPIDEVYGAGEVHIANSYQIITAGEQEDGTVSTTGWDFNSLSKVPGPDTLSRSYDITIPARVIAEDLSILLNWNHSGGTDPTNLKMSLERVSDTTALLDSSDSAVDNVEHIYYRNLPPGTYRFTVSFPDTGLPTSITTEYGLAWQTKLGRGPETITTNSATNKPMITVSNLFRGRTHVIERSFTMADGSWGDVHTFTPTEWQTFSWEDPDGINSAGDAGFYRMRWSTP